MKMKKVKWNPKFDKIFDDYEQWKKDHPNAKYTKVEI